MRAAEAPEAQWVIDSRLFSSRREVLGGELGEEQLPRLADEAVEAFAPFRVRLEGVRSPRGKEGLHLSLRGSVSLQCQRCMGAVQVDVATEARFEWVESESALDADDDDEWDLLQHADRFDVLHLVEDELLLALPFAPMHEVCEPVADTSAGDKVSPFAALAGLRGKR
jgi:uncharacterized protein